MTLERTFLVAAVAAAVLGSAPAYADCGISHSVAGKERPVAQAPDVQAPDTAAGSVMKPDTASRPAPGPARPDNTTTTGSTAKPPLALNVPSAR